MIDALLIAILVVVLILLVKVIGLLEMVNRNLAYGEITIVTAAFCAADYWGHNPAEAVKAAKRLIDAVNTDPTVKNMLHYGNRKLYQS
jgi:uncharacterized membrane protein